MEEIYKKNIGFLFLKILIICFHEMQKNGSKR
jgi:hypothetical protein